MLKHIALAGTLALATVAGGCSGKYAVGGANREADKRLAQAEKHGASESSIAEARATYDYAAAHETKAKKDIEEARKDMDVANERLGKAIAALSEKEFEVAQLEGAASSVKASAGKEDERRTALREDGVGDKEVDAARSHEEAVQKRRMAGLKAHQEQTRQELELARLEKKYAEDLLAQSRERMDSAQERLKIARQLFEGIGERAESAEAEALAGEREALDARLKSLDRSETETGVDEGVEGAEETVPARRPDAVEGAKGAPETTPTPTTPRSQE